MTDNLPEGLENHPAVHAYWRTFRTIPPLEAQMVIAREIADLAHWQATLDWWIQSSYRALSVPKIIQRYWETSPDRPRRGQDAPRGIDRCEQCNRVQFEHACVECPLCFTAMCQTCMEGHGCYRERRVQR